MGSNGSMGSKFFLQILRPIQKSCKKKIQTVSVSNFEKISPAVLELKPNEKRNFNILARLVQKLSAKALKQIGYLYGYDRF